MERKITIRDELGQTRYDLAYDDTGNPADPCPVFCVHGIGHTRHVFDHMAQAFARQGRRVLNVDMAGHGQSGWAQDPLRYFIPDYAQDCAQMLATLAIRKVDWVGISMGGLIGIRAIVEQGVDVAHFVMVDVAPEVPWGFIEHLADWFEQDRTFEDRQSFIAWRVAQMQDSGPMTDEQRRYRASFDGRENPDGSWTDVYDKRLAICERMAAQAREDWNDWALYEKIVCPTLVLHGGISKVLTPPLVEKMQATGPRPQVIEVPGIGHFPALADACQLEAVAAFLARTDR